MYIPSFPTYLSVFIFTKSEFISSCIRPAVGSNIVQITRSTFFKWPPVAISDQYHNLYICYYITLYWCYILLFNIILVLCIII